MGNEVAICEEVQCYNAEANIMLHSEAVSALTSYNSKRTTKTGIAFFNKNMVDK